MASDENDVPEDDGNPDDDLAVSCGGKLSLEKIVDSTGEFEHLNELVVLRIRKCGGFSGAESYLKEVTPILDLLEVEIRVKYSPGITRARMKKIIHEWIDEEIRHLC